MSNKLVLFVVLHLFILSSLLFSQPPGSSEIERAREFFNAGVKNGIDGDFQAAIANFEKAIDLNPLFAEAFLYKGLAEIETGNYETALKDLTITIELDPGFSDQAHYFRGLTKYFQEAYIEAIDDLSIAIRMNPDFVAFYQRGKANLKLGEYRRSLQDFDIALRLNEEFHEGYLYRGICLYYLEEYEDAMNDLEMAKVNLPANPKAFYYSGRVRLKIKNSYVAIEDLDKAIELDPDFAQAYEARSQARQNTGNIQAAAADREMARSVKTQSGAEVREQTAATTPAEEKPAIAASTDIDFAGLFGGAASRSEQKDDALKEDKQQVQPQSEDSSSIAETETGIPDINQIDSGTYNKSLKQVVSRGFGVQVASYSNTSNLMNLAEAYEEKYEKPVFINVSFVNGRKLYKLIIGQFDNRASAETLRDKLRAGSFPDSFLVVFENL